ncbi:MAG TPA: ribose-phosphate diphosphokinase [Candidatus Nanoarchaeia archaeon]|nr:ribose-phosphate diphosphokinase [Candidatus Nanoarchaeia archaeon]
MLIVSCSHGNHLGHSIARKLNANHSRLIVNKFPDDEILIKFSSGLKNQDVAIVQSFYRNISDCLIEVILASATAKELGAKKIILIAPYFPYLRQDKRFHAGESLSQGIIAGLIDKYFYEVLVIDPHLHRKNSLNQIFKIKSTRLTANDLIADYIRKNIKNPILIGPDSESYKWARNVAEKIGAESRILTKTRYSSYYVKVKLNKKIDLRDRNVVIVDDIVSTGHTIIEASKLLRKLGAKNIYCICVHGIFIEDALKKLKKNKINVISTNTIPNKASKIDVSGIIVGSLKFII